MEQFCAVKRQDERDDRVKQLMEAKIIAIQQEIRICSSTTQTLMRDSRIEPRPRTARAVLRYAERCTSALA